jgi:hypothetical protein
MATTSIAPPALGIDSGEPSRAVSDGSLTGPGGRKIRFGVAFRLVGALLAITAFALAAIVAAIYAFSQYRQAFNRIANSDVPILIAAGDIAARSQTLAATAPNLAAAESHSECLHQARRGSIG